MSRTLLPPIFVLSFVLTVQVLGNAPVYQLLAEFEKPGAQSLAPLVQAGDGNYYGTAVAGGAADKGTIFRLTPSGTLTSLFSFAGSNGAAPSTALCLGGDGALYGTTSSGGTGGFGTAFKITTGGTFTMLTSFTGTAGDAKGSAPQTLVFHADGNFYGTTLAGGAAGHGTVFRMTPAGTVTTLGEFTGMAGAQPGAAPLGSLAVSGAALYGVTQLGGAGNFGTIYSITTAGAFTPRGEFTGVAGVQPGSNPAGPLFLNTDGVLYGTTEFGGVNDFGTAFKITTAAVPVFTGLGSFADPTGSQPSGKLARDSVGQLYGTTAGGGDNGYGVIYKMTTAGARTVLKHFTGETGLTTGSVSRGGLILGSNGQMHGTTSAGGPGNRGVAFRISTSGSYTLMANFSHALGWNPSGAPVFENASTLLFPQASGGNNGGGALVRLTLGGGGGTGTPTLAASLGGTVGEGPTGGLVPVAGGFAGVTARGGTSNRGTAYKFTGSGVTFLTNYTTTGGSASEGPLVVGIDNNFYGTSKEGGAASKGTVYKLTPAGVRTRLASFSGITATSGNVRGNKPRGALAAIGDGRLYGVTQNGGAADAGTLFRIDASGAVSTVVDFTAVGPRQPQGGLVMGNDGKIYGTTSLGGAANAGTIIRFDPADESWSVLADFVPAMQGTSPIGQLAVGPDGALYGLTASGGLHGFGTVFRCNIAGETQVLTSFTGSSAGAPGTPTSLEGTETIYGGICFGADGNLYGVTAGGGSLGGGVAFRITDVISALSQWKRAELGNPAAADSGDPDHDGLTTLFEYISGTDPTVPNQQQPLAVTADENGLQLTFEICQAATGATVTLQESESMAAGTWTAISPPPVLMGVVGLKDIFSATVPYAPGRKYFRLLAQPLP